MKLRIYTLPLQADALNNAAKRSHVYSPASPKRLNTIIDVERESMEACEHDAPLAGCRHWKE